MSARPRKIYRTCGKYFPARRLQTEKKTNSEPFPSETQAEKDANFQIPPQETGINPDSQAYERNTETKTEGGNENAGKGTEPVIQTGHASPFILLAALGLCGVVLVAASVLEGKKICP